MTKKITELPAASVVDPTDVLPMVDLSGPTTQKVTITQLATAMNGLVATLTGSNFTGAVTISSPATTPTAQGSDVWFYASGSSGVNTGANRKVTVLNDTVVSGTLSVGSLNFSSFATLQVTGSSQTVDIGGQTSVPLQTTNFASDQNGAFLVQRKARGTPSAPTQVLASDILGGIIARGFGAGSSYFPSTNAGAIFFVAESDFQSTSNATRFQLRLTPTGSTTTSTVLNISSEGRASFDPSGTLASTKGTDVFFYVSGSANVSGAGRKVVLFGGDVVNSGSVTFANVGGATGSITQLVGGAPFVTVPAGNVVTISTGSNGQIVVSGSVTGFMPLAGGTFTGAVTAVNNGGITGSITVTTAGTPFITVPAGNGISITTGSNGQIILSGSSGGSGSGAPTTAQYITLATDATLTAERTFTPSTGLKAVDGGANSTYTLTVHDGTFAALTGSIFTGVVQHSSPATTLGSDVFTFFSGSCGLTGSAVGVNATRKATLFGGDVMMSGTLVEQRPTQAPKAYYLQHNSQSVVSAVGPTVVYVIENIPSGAFSVSVEAAATHATPSLGAGGFRAFSAFVNNLGTVTQLGAIGGVVTGTFGGSGASAWNLALDASDNKVRLLISGSAATSTWAWWLTAVGSSP